MGESCVPSDPKRVVVMAGTEIELVVGLGVMPVGASTRPAPDFMKERLEGVINVGWPEPNLETILSLKPDVILSAKGRVGQIYDQLSQIAPTVLAKGGSDNWKGDFQLFAEALGKTERAEQLMSQYQQRTERLQAQLGNPQNRPEVSVVNVRVGRIILELKDIFSGIVLHDAGLPRPPSQDEKGGMKEISLESIEAMEGDVMFLYTYGGSGAESALAKLKADPLWSKLDVVQRERVYEVPEYWMGKGPISANLILDDLFKYLIQEES
jgi:iron complex transport system substrate-binding protein